VEIKGQLQTYVYRIDSSADSIDKKIQLPTSLRKVSLNFFSFSRVTQLLAKEPGRSYHLAAVEEIL